MTAVVIGPRTVPVPGVDKELESIWKSLAPASLEEAAPVMQASIVNLAAVAADDSLAEHAARTFARLAPRAPCRFIILNAQPEADPPGLTAQVSVLCENSGGRQICCEVINLRAAGFSADTLPATAQAFYAPDLPVVVWWPSPLGRADLPAYAAAADRLVFDSINFSRTELARAAEIDLNSRRTRTAISDLNWARLTPYRQLFAQFFDSDECRRHLAQIESVSLAAAESAAELMTGWLLSRLDREPDLVRPDQISVSVTDGGGPVFRSLVMRCRAAEFSVTRTGPDTVEARARLDGETVARVSRVPLASLEKLLADELGRTGRDRAYDAAVRAAVRAAIDLPHR